MILLQELVNHLIRLYLVRSKLKMLKDLYIRVCVLTALVVVYACRNVCMYICTIERCGNEKVMKLLQMQYISHSDLQVH